MAVTDEMESVYVQSQAGLTHLASSEVIKKVTIVPLSPDALLTYFVSILHLMVVAMVSLTKH